MKKVFLSIVFITSILTNINLYSNNEVTFDNITYNIINTDKIPDNPNFANKIIINKVKFNDIDLNTYTQYGENGKLQIFAIDKNNNNPDHRAWFSGRDGCGKYCAQAETDFGATLCWLACRLLSIDRPAEGSEVGAFNFDWLKDFFFKDRYNFCYNQNEITDASFIESNVFSDNLLISSSIVGLNNDLNITGICFAGNGNLDNRAKSELGKCLEWCGANGKSNGAVWYCAWDCLFLKTNSGKVNIEK